MRMANVKSVWAITEGIVLYEDNNEVVLRVGKDDKRITYCKDTDVLEVHKELYHCEVIAEDGDDVDLTLPQIIEFMMKEFNVLSFRKSHGLNY